MQSAAVQALVVAIEPAGEEVPPQAHTALAATVETGITVARVFSRTRETLRQAVISRVEREFDAAISERKDGIVVTA